MVHVGITVTVHLIELGAHRVARFVDSHVPSIMARTAIECTVTVM